MNKHDSANAKPLDPAVDNESRKEPVKDPVPKRDYRTCGDCHVRMRMVWSFGGDFEGRNADELYQCPNCKEIAVL